MHHRAGHGAGNITALIRLEEEAIGLITGHLQEIDSMLGPLTVIFEDGHDFKFMSNVHENISVDENVSRHIYLFRKLQQA